MPTQTRDYAPEDPLESYSGLSRVSRVLASVANARHPYDPDDLYHAHNFLKAMPMQSPRKLLEQAKVILDGSSGISNSEIPSVVTFKDKNDVGAAKVTDNPQERRPGLGRKRARFSLKPNSSQPTVNLEPTLDLDKLKDPEAFFVAFEKHENAKRELQKQTGGAVTDLNQLNPSMAPRPRRQGMLGRSVKYKHLYATDLSSQETIEENILSAPICDVQQEITNPTVASQEINLVDAEVEESELFDEVTKKENRVSDLLNELLTSKDEDLEEDGAVALLQEHLQIKPIDLSKLCLPDLQGVRRIDLKAMGADLPKRRNALSDIHNVVNGMSSRTPKKHKSTESSVPCLASPTPPKSPFSSIISLKKRIWQSNSLMDSFSAHNIDQSTSNNTSTFGHIAKLTDEISIEKRLSISAQLKSPVMEENGIANVNTSLPEVDMGDATHSSDKAVNDLTRSDCVVEAGSSGITVDVVGSVEGSCKDNHIVSETSGRPDANRNDLTNELTELSDKVEDLLEEAVHSVQPDFNKEEPITEILNDGHCEFGQTNHDLVKDHASDDPFQSAVADLEEPQHHNVVNLVQPDLNMEDSISEKLDSTQTGLDQTIPVVVEDHGIDDHSKTADVVERGPEQLHEVNSVQPNLNMEDSTAEILNCAQIELDHASRDLTEGRAIDGSSKTADTGPQHYNEEVQTSTRKPSKKKSKPVSRPRKKEKREGASRRQSLAAFGTSWASGVRKSTRIKSRPLEYWKGERFLYGRVQESLTTVIGIKYASPGTTDGKPCIKVKSYVSDKYKDFVELAARF